MSTFRPFLLSHLPSSARLSFPVAADQSNWTTAEISRDAFNLYLESLQNSPLNFQHPDHQNQDFDQNQHDMLQNQDSNLILLSHYLEFSSSRPADRQLTLAALTYFHQKILVPQNLDLHSLAKAKTSSENARKQIIRSYYLARTSLEAHPDLPKPIVGRLWRDQQGKKVVGVFGGQGVNETYWDELVNLYSLYPSLLQPYLETVDAPLTNLARSVNDNTNSLYKDHGIHVLDWLTKPSTKPSVSYLATCAISLPLIGLVQIAHYITIGRTQSLTPNELSQQLSGGVTGHSQGVVVATLVAGGLPASENDWPHFYQVAIRALTLLFHIGLRGSVAFPPASLPPKVTGITADQEGLPTPMLAVTGLPLEPLQKAIGELDGLLCSELAETADARSKGEVQVSLFNGPKAFVVTGNPRSLVGLVSALRKGKAEPGQDQSRIPFSKRLPVFSMRFLPIGVPYHSNYLKGCTQDLLRSSEEGGIGSSEISWWESQKKTLGCSVYNTETGGDLRTEKKGLLESLADQIFTSPIHWTKACSFPDDTTHIVDFGLGNLSGIGSLVARNTEGRGMRMVFACLPASADQGGKFMNEVYDSASLIEEEKWSEKFKVTLIKTRNGRIHIDSPFSRLLSKPPLMVAGMTPCTVSAKFNAAVMNAGYHIELAGGGHYNAKALRSKVDAIRSQLQKPGLGLTLNALYINQRQFTFQLPLWLQMRQEGLPIEGFVVAAGVPSAEKAKEIIDGLRGVGIKHVSFKPGSVDGIRQVVSIAAANPDFPVILQWTGGRAGGHHSCEDFHQPILSTYASIRAQKNLVLVAGSGFGSAEDVYPYLTGEWSAAKFGVEPMPFDGILVASRMMVAKEAATSDKVKELIVQAAGVPDEKWEGTYERVTGGIITVTSELGEPIHKIATRGIKLWKEFDETVFALPREKRAAWLAAHREYVIKRLNADFQKPWFAEKDGQPAELGDMTYEETANRLIKLMYVSHQSRWIDPTLRNLVGDWLRRIEERLSVVNGAPKVSELQSFAELEDPAGFLPRFFRRYPDAKTQILASEDIAYFLALCQRPGQKPVPFIPVLDSNFGIWFKKDSLWQAEDIDAVLDQDAQRVAILQGPVAVTHSRSIDETAGEILGGIESGLIARLVKDVYHGDESLIPTADYLAPAVPEGLIPDKLSSLKIAYATREEQGRVVHTYDIDGVLPAPGEWLSTVAHSQPKTHWLSALLSTLSVVSEASKSLNKNPVPGLLQPRHSQRVQVITAKDGEPVGVKVFGGVRNPVVT